MSETKEETRLYESETIALPSIRVVLGEVPNPDPAKRRTGQKTKNPYNPDLARTIRRIIAHIEGM
jgi:hypothetical protein